MGNDTKSEEVKKRLTELDKCIECGTCTFWCPVYDVKTTEVSVARGKNVLVKALLKGEIEYNEELVAALSTCTLCMACTEHCPVECDVKSIMIAARSDKVKAQGLDRKLLSTSGYYRTGRFLAARSDSHLNKMSEDKFLRLALPLVNSPPEGVETKMRVGYFVGCTTNFLFPELGGKIIRFLTKNGVEVVVPREQGCCGSPAMLRIGDFETARERADINVKAFENLNYVITGCPTCAATMKGYADYLADNPERKENYTNFARKVSEIIGFLVDKAGLPASAYQAKLEAKEKRVTWHDPCHLARSLGVREQPREILKSLRDVEYVEMARADWCCGMAGVFSESHDQLSKKIADKKIETISASGADIVATACPGCILQITDAIERHRTPQKIIHIMELLD